MSVSSEIELMRAPTRVYARLVENGGRRRLSVLVAIRRPVFVAVLIGAVIAMASTGRVSPLLVARSTMAWSFAVAVQVAAALLVVTTARNRRVGVVQSFDLLFASHGPWSVWMLAAAAWACASPPIARGSTFLFPSLLIPMIWTPFIVAAFCRVVLGDSPRAARWRTAAHQALTIGTLIVLFGLAVGIWPRIIYTFWGAPGQ